jgi:hypothetical protein
MENKLEKMFNENEALIGKMYLTLKAHGGLYSRISNLILQEERKLNGENNLSNIRVEYYGGSNKIEKTQHAILKDIAENLGISKEKYDLIINYVLENETHL